MPPDSVVVCLSVVDEREVIVKPCEATQIWAVRAEVAVEALDEGILHRRAGLDECRFTPLRYTQKNIALQVKSGPLSQTFVLGNRRPSRSSSRARGADIEKSTRRSTHSRV